MDFEIGSILLVRRRGRRIVRGVQEASNAVAGLRGNPEVGASRVKDDLESLGRRADGDLGEVCPIQVSKAVHSLAGALSLRADLHWAFMKLVTGTGWPPLILGRLSLNMTSARLVGRTPIYFWPSCWTWASIDEPSWWKKRSVSARATGQRQIRAASYQLLLQGNLLQLHLMDAGLGGANKRRSGNQCALHTGRHVGLDDGVFLV